MKHYTKSLLALFLISCPILNGHGGNDRALVPANVPKTLPTLKLSAAVSFYENLLKECPSGIQACDFYERTKILPDDFRQYLFKVLVIKGFVNRVAKELPPQITKSFCKKIIQLPPLGKFQISANLLHETGAILVKPNQEYQIEVKEILHNYKIIHNDGKLKDEGSTPTKYRLLVLLPQSLFKLIIMGKISTFGLVVPKLPQKIFQ